MTSSDIGVSFRMRHWLRYSSPRRGQLIEPLGFVVGLRHVWGEHATTFLATGTAVRQLSAEHPVWYPRQYTAGPG